MVTDRWFRPLGRQRLRDATALPLEQSVGAVSMLDSAACLKYAEQAEAIARLARDPENRATLQEIADRWRKLAAEAPSKMDRAS